jgi:DMSO reductase anchor subunit
MTNNVTKARNQVKSKFYYIFWGVATISVLAGQLYVGSGYRAYANALLRIYESIEVSVGRPNYY